MNQKNKTRNSENKMTHQERKALQFYKMTRCNWGKDTLYDEVSDKKYLKHIRDIRKGDNRLKDK